MTARPLELPAGMLGGRIASALLGGALVGYGQRRGGRWGVFAALAGAGVLARAMATPAASGIRRAGEARRTVRLRTVVHVRRSVHDVFTFCKDFEHFPRIIGSLRRVVDYEDGRSHWEVVTPSGQPLEWDATVTKYVPNSVIAWSSVSGSVVDTRGLLRFAPSDDGGTRLQVELTYTPHEMPLGDALLAIATAPLQEQLERDLARLGEYIEHEPAAPEQAPEQAPDDEHSTRLSA